MNLHFPLFLPLPMPLRVMVCGVFVALSFMVKVPETVPLASGLNLILIMQRSPG